MLRDYQRDMLRDLNRAWRRVRSVMVQMPTGTGKTHLMA
ncbi:MAG: DEAD/DEAH box helicase family protein, partial [Prevotella sp.]|nr:DEAD/DEAH box helicase family protein [Prevotella sp.]